MCGSVNDCASPNVCDTSGHCIAPVSAPSGDSGGCALEARAPANDRDAVWMLAALVVVGAASRRRRTR
jgi:hypothetical protein